MAKLDTITLFVERESYNESVTATAYPVEKGVPFTDHVERNPRSMTLNAFISGTGASDKLSKIRTMMHKGKIVKYVGRATASNIIILSVDHDRSTIKNGFDVTITLREVRIAKSPWVKAKKKKKTTRKPTDNTGKKKATSKKNRGTTRYHITRSGDTYWGLSRKYGTSIPQLRAWNKFPDRRIPQNIRLRVK